MLRALGVEEDMAHTSIRYGIGRFTTEAEARFVWARSYHLHCSICLQHYSRSTPLFLANVEVLHTFGTAAPTLAVQHD